MDTSRQNGLDIYAAAQQLALFSFSHDEDTRKFLVENILKLKELSTLPNIFINKLKYYPDFKYFLQAILQGNSTTDVPSQYTERVNFFKTMTNELMVLFKSCPKAIIFNKITNKIKEYHEKKIDYSEAHKRILSFTRNNNILKLSLKLLSEDVICNKLIITSERNIDFPKNAFFLGRLIGINEKDIRLVVEEPIKVKRAQLLVKKTERTISNRHKLAKNCESYHNTESSYESRTFSGQSILDADVINLRFVSKNKGHIYPKRTEDETSKLDKAVNKINILESAISTDSIINDQNSIKKATELIYPPKARRQIPTPISTKPFEEIILPRLINALVISKIQYSSLIQKYFINSYPGQGIMSIVPINYMYESFNTICGYVAQEFSEQINRIVTKNFDEVIEEGSTVSFLTKKEIEVVEAYTHYYRAYMLQKRPYSIKIPSVLPFFGQEVFEIGIQEIEDSVKKQLYDTFLHDLGKPMMDSDSSCMDLGPMERCVNELENKLEKLNSTLNENTKSIGWQLAGDENEESVIIAPLI